MACVAPEVVVQPKDEREEAVQERHLGCELSQDRRGKSRNNRAGGGHTPLADLIERRPPLFGWDTTMDVNRLK